MRDAMADLGGDPSRINPLVPVELVIDHSIQVDVFASTSRSSATPSSSSSGTTSAMPSCAGADRLQGLRGGAAQHRHLPPGEPRVPRARGGARDGQAFPDTLVGTDSHTTMVNGLGVLGWGVGGIEAEAAMLGQPVSMLIPQVVGFRLEGGLPEGATATDLVLTVTQMLRERGVVGKFVEFYGPGLPPAPGRPRHDREHGAGEGATCAIFPVDAETLPTSSSPAARPSGWSWWRPTAGSRGSSRRAIGGRGVLATRSSSTCHGRALARRAAPAAGPGGAARRRRRTSGRSWAS